jgi:hypothetical protein
MSTLVTDAPGRSPARISATPPAPRTAALNPSPAACCEECGYDLRGLSQGAPCPECGHVHAGDASPTRPDVLWRRSVTAGLALLLGVTLYATSSVLVQPFSDDLGGTLPALNMPGPKLWAIPLLQRPIGRSPQWPGVVGTRTALLSLLAVWLVTAPHPDESDLADARGRARRLVRESARWGAALPFGVAFGILLTTQGLWPADLPSYRMLLVSFVELPAAALLYTHLYHLARRVPGRDRRRLFERLRWMVPATILAGALLMGIGWLLTRTDWINRPPREIAGSRLLVFAAYGAAAVGCGMVATAAVGSLAMAYAASAFRGTRLLPSRLCDAARRASRFGPVDPQRLHYAAVAAGIVLLLLVALLATDEAPWSAAREFPSGNLPFYSFPGPRLVAATPFLGRRTNWDPLVSGMTLVAFNLAAVWLITLRPPGITTSGPDRNRDRLRTLTRWSSVFATGAALATAAAWESMEGRNGPYFRPGLRPEFFALAIVLCQAPPTAMLYACIARIAASEAHAPTLARRLRLLSRAIPALVIAAFLLFVLLRYERFARSAPALLAFCGVAGAVQLVAAVWSAATMATLAAKLVRTPVLGPAAQGTRDCFRTLGGDNQRGGKSQVPVALEREYHPCAG